jgi:hypothetical protein
VRGVLHAGLRSEAQAREAEAGRGGGGVAGHGGSIGRVNWLSPND